MLDRIQKELVEKLFPTEPIPKKKDIVISPEARPQPPERPQPQPRVPDFPPRQPFPDPDDPFGGGPLFDPPGGADLDPTGRRGRGGMLMEPPRGGHIGQPRIDPTNPFGPSGGIGGFPGRIGRGGGGRGGRNFGDAMGPPDFNNDNMFM